MYSGDDVYGDEITSGPIDPLPADNTKPEPGTRDMSQNGELSHSLCRHCSRPISLWDDASLWLGRDIYTHDDLVDGATDRPCDGVSCQNEEETEAQP